MEVEKITKYIGALTACFALIGGGYTATDKIGNYFKDNEILVWAPEHFSVSDGPANEEFKVVIARQKKRDDCSVISFKIEIKDSEYIVHEAKPNIAVFSGPATPTIDKFGYKFTINMPESVASGRATLLSHILYKCPEGEVLINYPSHNNLSFNIN